MLRLSEEQNIEVIRQAALLLEQENKRLLTQLVQLQRQLMVAKGDDSVALQLRLEALERQLAQRNQQLFGTSSEKRPAPAPATPPQERPAQTGHGPREQKQLPIVERVFTLDEPDKACPKCGGALREMKGQFEEAEEITVVERQFVVQKIKRQKYGCRCGECVETALGPPKLQKGARYSVEFAVEVAAQKYLDHLPLERQARIMGREGLEIDSNTLWDQINALARVLAPVHEKLHAHVLAQPVIGADETTWRLLGEESARWQVWAAAAPDAVCYRFLDSRSAEAGRELLRDYGGVVMADGYKAYETLQRKSGKFVLAHCWAHVRRKFVELEATFPAQAKQGIELIGQLYEIDRACPTGPPGDEIRRRLRDERARPVVAAFEAFVRSTPAIPQSGLAKAFEYALGCWPGLVRFLEDPRIPLDNNATERALRGVVVGRKNHYGSQSRRGTEVAALLYSLLESAKLAGVEPKAYLREATFAALRGESIPLPHELAAAPSN